MLTGQQIREARALLKITQRALADRAKLSFETICRAEGPNNEASITIAQSDIIRRALEKAGVEFTAKISGGAGVWLRKPQG